MSIIIENPYDANTGLAKFDPNAPFQDKAINRGIELPADIPPYIQQQLLEQIMANMPMADLNGVPGQVVIMPIVPIEEFLRIGQEPPLGVVVATNLNSNYPNPDLVWPDVEWEELPQQPGQVMIGTKFWRRTSEGHKSDHPL